MLPPLASEPGPVAVLASPADQADLIRRLARNTRMPAGVVIPTPPTIRHREAGTVVVSLVRSDEHRAVPFGEEPDWFPLALAHGRRRLILVGDPGTLARRAEWDRPLDHLDAAAARRSATWSATSSATCTAKGGSPGIPTESGDASMSGGRSASGARETTALLNLASREPASSQFGSARSASSTRAPRPHRAVRAARPVAPVAAPAIADGPAALDRLDARLGLGRGPLYRWLSDLCVAGLVTANDHYALTLAGETALADGTEPRPITERRRFASCLESTGRRGWCIVHGASTAAHGAGRRRALVGELHGPPIGMETPRRFPGRRERDRDVAATTGWAAWQRLALATGERPVIAIAVTDEQPGRVTGFVAGSDVRFSGWTVDGSRRSRAGRRPVFTAR